MTGKADCRYRDGREEKGKRERAERETVNELSERQGADDAPDLQHRANGSGRRDRGAEIVHHCWKPVQP